MKYIKRIIIKVRFPKKRVNIERRNKKNRCDEKGF